MLDMLLSGAPESKYFPNSGPGPKTLAYGGSSFGIFGEIDPKNQEFVSMLDIQATHPNSVVAQMISKLSYDYVHCTWVKIMYNGRVLYFPCCKLGAASTGGDATQMSPQNIYESGMMFGVRGDNKPYQLGASTNQFTVLDTVEGIRSYTLLVRTLRAGEGTSSKGVTQGGEVCAYGKLEHLVHNNPEIQKLLPSYYQYHNNFRDGYFLVSCSRGKENSQTILVCNWFGNYDTVFDANGFMTTPSTFTIPDTAVNGMWFPILELVPDFDSHPIIFNGYTFNGLPPEKDVTYFSTPAQSALRVACKDITFNHPLTQNGFSAVLKDTSQVAYKVSSSVKLEMLPAPNIEEFSVGAYGDVIKSTDSVAHSSCVKVPSDFSCALSGGYDVKHVDSTVHVSGVLPELTLSATFIGNNVERVTAATCYVKRPIPVALSYEPVSTVQPIQNCTVTCDKKPAFFYLTRED